MQLQNPANTVEEIVSFLKQTFEVQGKTHAVIAVSGGIDSAVSLSLISQVLPKENIICLMLPYGDQDVVDAETICHWNGIPQDNWHEINIKPIVDSCMSEIRIASSETFRLANLMARSRMMVVYDFAKRFDALVIGTENKSEKFLGYFTRFGDEASDVEPLQHLYKTQIRQLAEHLDLPEIFTQKAPTAGLWNGQTDEVELGFTYAVADVVLEKYIDEQIPGNQIVLDGIDPYLVQKVIERVKSQQFKHEVPYTL